MHLPTHAPIHSWPSRSGLAVGPVARLRGLALTVTLALTGCGLQADATQPGWFLEKTGTDKVQIVITSQSGQRQVWEGTLKDDSPKSTPLTPLVRGQDNGLFRWVRPDCAELSFVLTREELKCTTCTDPSVFVPYTASCPLDQSRLPVQGWKVLGLERPE